MFPQRKDESHNRKIISDIRSNKPTVRPVVRAQAEEFAPQLRPAPKPKTNRRAPSAVIVALAVVVLLLAAGFYTYATATLTIAVTPKKTRFDLGSGISVKMNAKEFSSAQSRRAEGKSVGSQKFANRASGVLIVYNNFNSAPQILTIGTRFRSQAGLIYRSKSRVVVPGKSGDKPGTVDVAVSADEPGEKYNTGPTDFVIPGFAGSPKYEKFYARSKSDIKGGATGEGKVVGKIEADELLNSLENQVRDEALKNLGASIPADAKKFPDKYEYKTALRATDPAVGSPADAFFAEARGEARTLAIERAVFTDGLASALFRDQFRQGAYRIRDESALNITNVDFDYSQKMVTMRVQGTVTFEWTFDTEALKKEVSTAANNDAINSILKTNYPGIAEAKIVFKPAFLKRIPSDTKRITVELPR